MGPLKDLDARGNFLVLLCPLEPSLSGWPSGSNFRVRFRVRFICLAKLIFMFLYLIFQYLSIFLPNFISFEKTDKEVIQIVRMAIFMIVTFIFLVEHGLISQPNEASGVLHVI